MKKYKVENAIWLAIIYAFKYIVLAILLWNEPLMFALLATIYINDVIQSVNLSYTDFLIQNRISELENEITKLKNEKSI